MEAYPLPKVELDYGLSYQLGDDTDHADGQLPQTADRLVMYADISYPPPYRQYRSIQGVAGQWTGETLLAGCTHRDGQQRPATPHAPLR